MVWAIDLSTKSGYDIKPYIGSGAYTFRSGITSQDIIYYSTTNLSQFYSGGTYAKAENIVGLTLNGDVVYNRSLNFNPYMIAQPADPDRMNIINGTSSVQQMDLNTGNIVFSQAIPSAMTSYFLDETGQLWGMKYLGTYNGTRQSQIALYKKVGSSWLEITVITSPYINRGVDRGYTRYYPGQFYVVGSKVYMSISYDAWDDDDFDSESNYIMYYNTSTGELNTSLAYSNNVYGSGSYRAAELIPSHVNKEEILVQYLEKNQQSYIYANNTVNNSLSLGITSPYSYYNGLAIKPSNPNSRYFTDGYSNYMQLKELKMSTLGIQNIIADSAGGLRNMIGTTASDALVVFTRSASVIIAPYASNSMAEYISSKMGIDIQELKKKMNEVNTNVTQTKASADSANSSADGAKTNTWDTSTGKSAATLAREARDRADAAASKSTEALNAINSTNTNLTNKITDSQTAITNALNNMESNIVNIQNYLPPTIGKVYGYNNASATDTNSFKVSMDYSNVKEFRYKVGSGSWSSWMPITNYESLGYLNVSGLNTKGMYTIQVELKSGSNDSTVKGSMTVFRL
jgi:hypothetical protein